MKNNAELIKKWTSINKDSTWSEVHSVASWAMQIIEDQPFDVLQRLRDGGAFEVNGMKFKRYLSNFIAVEDGAVPSWDLFFYYLDMVKPYHEPPAEGSREWAMEQDGRVHHKIWQPQCWVNFKQGTFQNGNNLKTSWYSSQEYDTGWSLYVEPRKPGWYWAILKTCPDINAPWEWNGKNWENDAGTPLDEDTFHWIGDTRIELETPEDTPTNTMFGDEGEKL